MKFQDTHLYEKAVLFEKLKPYYPVLIVAGISMFIILSLFYSTIEISPKNPVTTIYYVDHISKAHQAVIDSFNSRYKNSIRVEAINLPFNTFSTNERKELLSRYLRSKSDRIDIFAVDQIWIPRFAKWGVNLEKYFRDEIKDQILDRALISCTYNDTLCALPLYLDISLLYARKDLLLQHPSGQALLNELSGTVTWERFAQIKNELKLNVPYYIFQADEYEGLMCILMELVTSAGGSIVKNDTLHIRNNPALLKAVKQLVALVNNNPLSPKSVTGFKENESFRYFIANNAVFVRAWPSFSGNDENVFPGFNKVKENLIYLPNPYFERGKQVSVFGGWNLMISKNSRKIPEAVAFLRFATGPEAQKILYKEGQYLPIVKSLYRDSSFIGKYPELKFFENYLQRGIYRPFLKDYTLISDILVYYVKMAITGAITPEQSLQLAADRITSKKAFLK